MLKEIEKKLGDCGYYRDDGYRKKINDGFTSIKNKFSKNISNDNYVSSKFILNKINEIMNCIGDVYYNNNSEKLSVSYFENKDKWAIRPIVDISLPFCEDLKEMEAFVESLEEEENFQNFAMYSTAEFYHYFISRNMDLGKLILMPTFSTMN